MRSQVIEDWRNPDVEGTVTDLRDSRDSRGARGGR
jgi:hypothetical protein